MTEERQDDGRPAKPTPSARLSETQRRLLARFSTNWAPLPRPLDYGVLKALQRKGFVEVGRDANAGKGWRRTLAGIEALT